MNSNVKHPDVVKAEFTIVAAKYIKLSFYYIGCVTTSRARSVVTCLHFVPVVRFNVEYVYVVHPMYAVIPSEVVNFTIHKATRGAHACAWLHPCD